MYSKGAQILKQFSRICDWSSLCQLCLYILHAYVVYLFICLVYLCSIEYMLGIVCSHLCSTKIHGGTSTFNLEEPWGDSPEPFTRNSATLLCYTLCVSLIVFICIIYFNFALVCIRLSSTPIHPPLGVFQNLPWLQLLSRMTLACLSFFFFAYLCLKKKYSCRYFVSCRINFKGADEPF